jgi:hypothetical protein
LQSRTLPQKSQIDPLFIHIIHGGDRADAIGVPGCVSCTVAGRCTCMHNLLYRWFVRIDVVKINQMGWTIAHEDILVVTTIRFFSNIAPIVIERRFNSNKTNQLNPSENIRVYVFHKAPKHLCFIGLNWVLSDSLQSDNCKLSMSSILNLFRVSPRGKALNYRPSASPS